jgi:hypothetical protein
MLEGQAAAADAPGTASALLGAGQCFFAALVAPVASLWGDDSHQAMKVLILSGFALAALAFLVLVQARRRASVV